MVKKIIVSVTLLSFIVFPDLYAGKEKHGGNRTNPKHYDRRRHKSDPECRRRDERIWRIEGSSKKSGCSRRECVAGWCGGAIGMCLGECIDIFLANPDASPQEKIQQGVIVKGGCTLLGAIIGLTVFGKKEGKLKKD